METIASPIGLMLVIELLDSSFRTKVNISETDGMSLRLLTEIVASNAESDDGSAPKRWAEQIVFIVNWRDLISVTTEVLSSSNLSKDSISVPVVAKAKTF